eukprot:scaffold56116_cov72-Phaeocystis_antarctica.AAC.3
MEIRPQFFVFSWIEWMRAGDGSTCGAPHGTPYVRHARGWRLVRVACTYSTAAPGRTAQHRAARPSAADPCRRSPPSAARASLGRKRGLWRHIAYVWRTQAAERSGGRRAARGSHGAAQHWCGYVWPLPRSATWAPALALRRERGVVAGDDDRLGRARVLRQLDGRRGGQARHACRVATVVVAEVAMAGRGSKCSSR